MDPVPVGLQGRDDRGDIGVELGAGVEEQQDDRREDPGPQHAHRLTAEHHAGHADGHTGDDGDVLEEVSPRETLRGQTAAHEEEQVDGGGEPDHHLRHPAPLVGAAELRLERLDLEGLRQVRLGHRPGGDTRDVVLLVVGDVRALDDVTADGGSDGHLLLRGRLLGLPEDAGTFTTRLGGRPQHAVVDERHGKADEVQDHRGLEGHVRKLGEPLIGVHPSVPPLRVGFQWSTLPLGCAGHQHVVTCCRRYHFQCRYHCRPR